ncbi:non-ribosomal peptide synthetase [Salinarimonas sp. NSM]|uniref:non-ribosomal peptide synthetase n=1 Tax=Salinarimonas sp. NSM TaxID=3458003 RepID=UPI0040356B7F
MPTPAMFEPHEAGPPITVAEALAIGAPAHAALVEPGGAALTYADLRARARSLAAALADAGLGDRPRVACLLPNGIEAAATILAAMANGACAPLDPARPEAEIRAALAALHVEAVIVPDDARLRAALAGTGLPLIPPPTGDGAGDVPSRPDDAPRPDDPALVVRTSGTTGGAKVVVLSQRRVCAAAHAIARWFALGQRDRCYNPMPLAHVHGLLTATLATVVSGGTVACPARFAAEEAFAWLAAGRATWYTAVPTIHQALLAQADARGDGTRFTGLRFVRSSSAALPAALIARIEALADAPLVETYGLTETASMIVANPLPPAPRKPGSVGVPVGARLRIVAPGGRDCAPGEIGEVLVAGPTVIEGYEGDPDASARAIRDGWLHTGDLGRLDADGYLVLHGRLDETIKRGGHRVALRDVDDALLALPGVAEAAAFAVAHPTLGRDLAAAVVPESGACLVEADLREALLAMVAGPAVPSRILVVAALPTIGPGKLDRRGMGSRFADALRPARVAPATDAEEALAALWREVLGVDPGRDDGFIAIGGDSLSAARLATLASRRFGIALAPADLVRTPTLSALAARVEALILADIDTLEEASR